ESGKVYTIPDAIREIALTKLRADEKRIAAQITRGVPPLRVPQAEEPPSADAAAATAAAPAAAPAGAVAAAAAAADQGYAISEYPDVPGITRRLKALVDQPVRGIRHDAMLDVLGYFEHKCAASKELTERAK